MFASQMWSYRKANAEQRLRLKFSVGITMNEVSGVNLFDKVGNHRQ